ncbi:hypothetical protein FPQ18DRAFT_401522 [Pyronema domesticum]|nr:hypothetical protein FPQ18DRAFT_401522 [Pyronema domesticum]
MSTREDIINELGLKFMEKQRQLFNDPTFANLTVKAGTTTFKVHKAVLNVHTSFFTNATKEGGFLESKDNTVTIEEHSAHSVWRFLMYCYTGDYREGNNADITDEVPVNDRYLKHIRVHALADMLNIDCLKILAAEKLWLKVRNNFETIRNMLVMEAHRHMAYFGNKEGFMDAFQDIDAFQDMGEFTADLLVRHKQHLKIELDSEA